MARIKVVLDCNADRAVKMNNLGADHLRIIEFMDPETQKGGLISFRRLDTGELRIEVYRVDPGVTVIAPEKPSPRTSKRCTC